MRGHKILRLSKALVEHVSGLAQIRLAPDEIERMAEELARVLEYVDILESVDTKGVDPTWHGMTAGDVQRPDAERPSLPRERALANAPATRDGMFLIPRILGEGEE